VGGFWWANRLGTRDEPCERRLPVEALGRIETRASGDSKATCEEENRMASHAEALLEFYSGEVLGEAIYSALLSAARNDDERLKWGTLLQLETETKAWLRAPMVAHGVSIAEQSADRDKGIALAEQLKPLPWAVQMQAVHHGIVSEFIPRYQGHADAARARGAADEEAVCLYMVEHERAQLEFTERELAGASSDRSLEPLVKFLRYPIQR
jgi:hypothetical protein